MTHSERHPEYVEGCYPCKLLTLQWRIPAYMQAKHENESEELKATTLADVAKDPKRFEQAGTRWV